MPSINGYAIAVSMLDSAIHRLKAERKEIEEQLAASRADQVKALRALQALYNLSGDLKKPIEHEPTRDALRLAEMALFGYTTTPLD